VPPNHQYGDQANQANCRQDDSTQQKLKSVAHHVNGHRIKRRSVLIVAGQRCLFRARTMRTIQQINMTKVDNIARNLFDGWPAMRYSTAVISAMPAPANKWLKRKPRIHAILPVLGQHRQHVLDHSGIPISRVAIVTPQASGDELHDRAAEKIDGAAEAEQSSDANERLRRSQRRRQPLPFEGHVNHDRRCRLPIGRFVC
jgi:hypothetical protein